MPEEILPTPADAVAEADGLKIELAAKTTEALDLRDKLTKAETKAEVAAAKLSLLEARLSPPAAITARW